MFKMWIRTIALLVLTSAFVATSTTAEDPNWQGEDLETQVEETFQEIEDILDSEGDDDFQALEELDEALERISEIEDEALDEEDEEVLEEVDEFFEDLIEDVEEQEEQEFALEYNAQKDDDLFSGNGLDTDMDMNLDGNMNNNMNYNSNTNGFDMMVGGQQQDDDGDLLSGILGDFADQGAGMAMMMFGQCFQNIDMDKMMENPFADVDDRCTTMETETFNVALTNFKSCAGFDLEELIEAYGSVMIGHVLNCGSYVMNTAADIMSMGAMNIETLKARDTPLPRVPQECVDAMVGDNPFGNSFLRIEKYPEQEMQCFADLARALPKCTLNDWPIPIVGTWLKTLSCIYGSVNDLMMPMIEETVKEQLHTMKSCLPVTIAPSQCKDVRNACLFDPNSPVFTFGFPPPFWNPPITKPVQNIAETNNLSSALEKYNSYREVCIPAADRAIWNVREEEQARTQTSPPVKVQEPSDVGGAAGFLDATQDHKVASGRTASITQQSSSSSSSSFLPGLLTGMVISFLAMFGIKRAMAKRQRGSMHGYGGLETFEMTESPIGFD